MSDRSRPRRPASLDGKEAELIWGDSDPALTSEVAHATANAVIRGPQRVGDDADLAGRVGAIIDAEGLDEIAALWSRSPATTLPGALWRLYLVRAWLQRDPETITMRYREGAANAPTDADVANTDGAADDTATAAPQPALLDEHLASLFSGTSEEEVDAVLDRAAAFLRVLAAGAATQTGWVTHDDEAARPVTGRSSALTATAEEMTHAAALARSGRLD